MEHDDISTQRYLSGDYLAKNPTWDMEDSPWKAQQIFRLLQRHPLPPAKIVEIGCGAGGVLFELRKVFPQSELFGFDISPDAARFWPQHSPAKIKFKAGDFFELSRDHYDLMLVLDVIEHVPNPFEFLTRLHGHADRYIFHFPLDLSAINLLRETPLLHVRDKAGHIHYYTKNLALVLLNECSYEVLDWNYTGAAFASPHQTWKTRLASIPRRLAYVIHKDAGVRLLGGETLLALAQVRQTKA